ncbi:hypothetical protein CSB37_00680 [bacterium DOLZORAL124_38_8]|nr:MAG: hypothetical protein CSB37_00680 [bacterium DOLZORAL124_38_8]
MKNLFNTVTDKFNRTSKAQFVWQTIPSSNPEGVDQGKDIAKAQNEVFQESMKGLENLDKETVYKELTKAVDFVNNLKEGEKGTKVSDGELLYNDGKSFAVKKGKDTVVYYFEYKSGAAHIHMAENPKSADDLKELTGTEKLKAQMLLKEYRLKDCLDGSCIAKQQEVEKVKVDHSLDIGQETVGGVLVEHEETIKVPTEGETVEKWTEKCVYEMFFDKAKFESKFSSDELKNMGIKEIISIDGKKSTQVKIDSNNKALNKKVTDWFKSNEYKSLKSEVSHNSTLYELAKNLGVKLKTGTTLIYEDGTTIEYHKTGEKGKMNCCGKGCQGRFPKSNFDLIYPGMKVSKIDENTLAITKQGVKEVKKTVLVETPGHTEYAFYKNGQKVDSQTVKNFITEYNKHNVDNPISLPVTQDVLKEIVDSGKATLKYSTIEERKVIKGGKQVDIDALTRVKDANGIRTEDEKDAYLKETQAGATESIDIYRNSMKNFEAEIKAATKAMSPSFGAISTTDGLFGTATGLVNIFLKDKIAGENPDVKAAIEANMPTYIDNFVQKQSGFMNSLSELIKAGKPVFKLIDRFALPIASLCAGILHPFDIYTSKKALAYNSENLKNRGDVVNKVNVYEEALKTNMKNRQHLGGLSLNVDVDAAYNELNKDLSGTVGEMSTEKVTEDGKEIEKLVGKDVMAKLGLAIDESGVIYAKEAAKMRKIVFHWFFDGRLSADGQRMKSLIEQLSHPIDPQSTMIERMEENQKRLGMLKNIIETARIETADDVLDRDVKKLIPDKNQQAELIKKLMDGTVKNTDLVKKVAALLSEWDAEDLAKIDFTKEQVNRVQEALKTGKYDKQVVGDAKEMLRSVFGWRYQSMNSKRLRGRHSMLHGYDEAARHMGDMIQNQRDLLAARYSIDGYKDETGEIDKAGALQHAAAFGFLESYVSETEYGTAEAQVIAQKLVKDFGLEEDATNVLAGYFAAGDSLKRAKYLSQHLLDLNPVLGVVKLETIKDVQSDALKNIMKVENSAIRECLLKCLEYASPEEYSNDWFLSVKSGKLPVMIPTAIWKKLDVTSQETLKQSNIGSGFGDPETITKTTTETVFNKELVPILGADFGGHVVADYLENETYSADGTTVEKTSAKTETVKQLSENRKARLTERYTRKLKRLEKRLGSSEKAFLDKARPNQKENLKALAGTKSEKEFLKGLIASDDSLRKLEPLNPSLENDSNLMVKNNSKQPEAISPTLTVEKVKEMSIDEALDLIPKGDAVIRLQSENSTYKTNNGVTEFNKAAYTENLTRNNLKAVSISQAKVEAGKVTQLIIKVEKIK